MRKSIGIIIAFLLAISLLALSCKKPAEHSVRVKNDSSLPLKTINIVGSVLVFTDIKVGTATDYKAIPEGKYTISGDLTTDEPFDISGTGKHKWSIVIADGGSVSLVDDGK